MEQSQFLGLLIGSIGTLLTIASVIVAIIVRPIINLNKSITKLNDSIDRLNDDSVTLRDRVTQHGKEIDENREKLIVHEQKIKHLEDKMR